MASPISLRTDLDAAALRREARRSRDAAQARRLLALSVIHDGGSRSEAARLGGVTLQIVRDWGLRLNAEGPAGLVGRKAPGATPKLGDAQRRALVEAVEKGPTPALHGVVRWRLVDLVQRVWEELHVVIGPQTLSRELRRLGSRKRSARPHHHAQDPESLETFQEPTPPPSRSPKAQRGASG